MDRRTSLQWMLTAALASQVPLGAYGAVAAARPYGTDPKLLESHAPGQLWPLILSPGERRTAAALCDLIIPADARSPSASAVGVVDFVDEWISAPYPKQQEDRPLVLGGLRWLDRESRRRFSRRFDELTETQMKGICDEICYEPRAPRRLRRAATFFARYRDLTAGGFYTTPVGRADIEYVGNTPSVTFDGPPLEVLRRVGLA